MKTVMGSLSLDVKRMMGPLQALDIPVSTKCPNLSSNMPSLASSANILLPTSTDFLKGNWYTRGQTQSIQWLQIFSKQGLSQLAQGCQQQ